MECFESIFSHFIRQKRQVLASISSLQAGPNYLNLIHGYNYKYNAMHGRPNSSKLICRFNVRNQITSDHCKTPYTVHSIVSGRWSINWYGCSEISDDGRGDPRSRRGCDVGDAPCFGGAAGERARSRRRRDYSASGAGDGGRPLLLLQLCTAAEWLRLPADAVGAVGSRST